MAYTFTKYSAGGGASEAEVVQIVKTNFEGGVGYEESGVLDLIPEQTVTLADGRWVSPSYIPLEVGNTYTFTFNGTAYQVTAKPLTIEGVGEYIYLGNGTMVGGEASDDPFLFASAASMNMSAIMGDDGEYTISLSGEATVQKKIDAKFLDTIGAKGTGYGAEVFNGGAAENASGLASHAEGNSTTASGDSSHAEGERTTASGIGSHAEGNSTTASSDGSHAEGNSTTASGTGSHAEGNSTTASGGGSHAEGSGTTASGDGSHAEGKGTTASGDYQHVQGQYNIEDTEGTYAHIVGNGAHSAARSNAHTLDWNGNAWFAGTVEGTALILASSTEGSTKRFKITVDDSGTLTATAL